MICKICGSMMEIITNEEGRKWHRCWLCKAQIPVDWGLRIKGFGVK